MAEETMKKTKLPEPNKKPSAKVARLLRKVAAHILAEPKRLVMEDWIRRDFSDGSSKPPCGTAACIAGWALELTRKPGQRRPRPDHHSALGSELLGMMDPETYEKATDYSYEFDDLKARTSERLFITDSWPEPYRTKYDAADNQAIKAKVVAQRIEHFIKTGK
jgi:hypothetical protein